MWKRLKIQFDKKADKMLKSIGILFRALEEMSMIDVCDYSEDPLKYVARKIK
jgi:hypothetical protein